MSLAQTLSAFLIEAGLPPDAGNTQPGDLTLEKVLEEKKIFDLSLRFEKTGDEDGGQGGWSSVVIRRRWLISSSMSGQVVLSDLRRERELAALDERRDHSKYVVKVAYLEDGEGIWVATAGWDGKVLLYRMQDLCGGDVKLGAPVASIALSSIPECILFVRDPAAPAAPILLLSRRDSTHLFYYGLPSTLTPNPSSPLELPVLGKQNLAPHSNTWTSFSPSSLALCPSDPRLIAIATSSVPHMKLIIARLLFPSTLAPSAAPATQAAQNRDALRTSDAEADAVLIHASTHAPQTPYSTPQVCWRPDGSGVWVNGDDGVVRGVEARSGKVVRSLHGGHEGGSKVRSLGSGDLAENGGECVVSGGFDRRLVVWKVAREDS
ncbi:MAG: hypothetical protein M1832_004504 [Thelocarpon impressellum]|nr:MAG: hypothetical protein M1832_004504 [Thelocarpon impressellum]